MVVVLVVMIKTMVINVEVAEVKKIRMVTY